MINTHTHTLSSSQMAFTTAGVEVFESGPTNFVLSFSGANVNGDYLKFLVKYDGDDNIYTVATPTDDIDKVRTQSIEKVFYPSPTYITSYTIDVSGVKNNLSIDQYRINLKIGRNSSVDYKSLKIINSYLYTNKDGANFCLLTVEGQNPRYVGNIVVPINKDPKWYLPPKTVPFVPNDDRILRTEPFTLQGAFIPITWELSTHQFIEEVQYLQYVEGTEGSLNESEYIDNLYYDIRVLRGPNGGVPSRAWDSSGLTAGETSRGDDIDDFVLIRPEDGIDYSIYDTDEKGGTFANEGIINITILDVYPKGIAP